MRCYSGFSRLSLAFLLLILFQALSLRAQGIITTIAGTDLTYPASSFSALSASFGQLTGVAVSPSGDVYFASSSRSLILRFNPQHNSLVVAAGIGAPGYSGDGGLATQAALNWPQQIAFDQSGNLYIADNHNACIRKIDTQGIISTFASNFGGWPNGVAVSPDGSVYASDYSRIYRFSAAGSPAVVAGATQQGFAGDGGPAMKALLFNPNALTFDNAGNLYIADTNNFRVRRITPDGTISTIAGIGTFGSPVDGAAATSSPIDYTNGLAVDAAGNLYAATGPLIKINSAGIISVLNNESTLFLTQPGLLRNASFNSYGVALDSTGSVYFTDWQTRSLYRASLTSGMVQIVAGYSPTFGVGDNGPAASAGLNGPSGLSLLKNGSLLIADEFNQRIRQILPSGTITTAFGTGVPGFAHAGTGAGIPLINPQSVTADAAGNIYIGEGGAIFHIDPSGTATLFNTRSLRSEWGMAVDLKGNLLVVDQSQSQVFRFGPDGNPTLFAGNGQAAFSGDGGPAVSASLNQPRGVTVGPDGSVYISDTQNNRIRKVTADGNISTFAMQSTQCCDGFTDLVLDPQGNLYVTANYNNRVEKVSPNGQITVIAGNGTPAFSGDGGPATAASLNQPWGIALDSMGNIFVGDSGNNRVREILAAPPSLAISASQLTLAATAGGQPVTGNIGVTASVQGLTYSIAFVTDSGGDWLGVASLEGAAPGVLTITADPSALQPGTYNGTVTLTNPLAAPGSLSIGIILQVNSAQPAKLSLDTTSLSFAFTSGAIQASQQLRVVNQGGGSISFKASAATSAGGNWLQISPQSGTTSASSPASITVSATPGNLPPGTYSGAITIVSPTTGDQFTLPVTMAISAAQQNILLSQTGLTFIGVSQGGRVLPQTLAILNSGSGSMSWTAHASTQDGSNWLTISNTGGTVARPLLDVSFVDVTVNAQSLAPGDYFGTIQVSAAGAANSPQTVLVVLNVLPPGANPGPEVRPTGLVFTGVEGASPGSQNVNISNVTGNKQLTYGSSATYVSGSNWLNYLPANATLDPSTPARVLVQPDFTSLAPGIYRGVITLAMSDGSIRNVAVLSVVAPGTAAVGSDRLNPHASGCTPNRLQIEPTNLQQAFTASLSQPIAMEMKVVDNCGNPITPQSGGVAVTAGFSNGDVSVRLVHTQNGNWSGTWQAQNGSPGSTVQVTMTALLITGSGTALSDQQYLTATLSTGAAVPVPRSVLNGADFSNTGVLAPGTWISVFGSGLGNAPALSNVTPLPIDLGGTEVTLGGQALPLLYASNGQVNAQVPYGLALNTQLQLQVKRGGTLSVPQALTVAPAQPAIFTISQTGQGQGAIVNVNNVVTDSSAPAHAGDTVVIYCTGLGEVNPPVSAGTPAPSSPLSHTTNTVSVTIGGQPANVQFAGLSPGLAGLYQINVIVQPGTPTGDAVPVVLTVAGQTSSPVTMALQ